MKKLLALVLALVMTLGLATVGANAAISDFQDAEDVYASDYEEAIAVMNAVGVFIGDGVNFRPNDKLDRASAAKLAAYFISNEKTAETMAATGTRFSDVKATDWFAKYVEYCASESVGVLAGDGSGKFNPSGELQTVAFAKMMLIALGYDAKREGFVDNSEWAINVMRLANSQGLMDGLDDVKPTDTLTRGQAAQMAFNTVKTPTVEYATAPITVTSGDMKVEVGGSTASYVLSTRGTAQTISREQPTNAAGNFFVEYGETHFDGLRLVPGTTNAFGMPTNQWTYKTENIGAWVKEPDLWYRDYMYRYEVYGDLGLTAASATTTHMIDGAAIGAQPITNTTAWMAGTDDGTETYVYVTYNAVTGAKTIDMYHINYYVAKVTKFVAGKSGVNTVTINPLVLPNGDSSALSSVNFSTTDTFAEGDIVVYTAANVPGSTRYAIQSIDKLDVTETGTLTKFSSTRSTTTSANTNIGNANYSFSVGSNTYAYSGIFYADNDDKQMAGFQVGVSKVQVYTDFWGYAKYVVGDVGMKNYAVVLGFGGTNVYGSQFSGATLLFPDGSIKQVTAKMSTAGATLANTLTDGTGAVVPGGTATPSMVGDMYGDLVTYTESGGVYTLTTVATGMWTSDAANTLGTTFTSGGSRVTFDLNNNNAINAGETFYATSNTVFFVARLNTLGTAYQYSVYTGFEQMPTLKNAAATDTQAYAYVANTSKPTQLDAVFFVVDDLAATTAKMIVVKDNGNYNILTTEVLNGSTVSYWTLPAVVDGEVTTVKVMNTVTVDNVPNAWLNGGGNNTVNAVTGIEKDANGIITAMTTGNAAYFAASNGNPGTDKAARGVLGVGGTSQAYNKNTVVYSIDRLYRSIAVSTVGATGTDANDRVYAALDTDGTALSNVFIVENNAPAVIRVTYGTTGDPAISAVYPYLEAGTTITVTFDGDVTGATSSNGGAGTAVAGANNQLTFVLVARQNLNTTFNITGITTASGAVAENYAITLPATWQELAADDYEITAY